MLSWLFQRRKEEPLLCHQEFLTPIAKSLSFEIRTSITFSKFQVILGGELSGTLQKQIPSLSRGIHFKHSPQRIFTDKVTRNRNSLKLGQVKKELIKGASDRNEAGGGCWSWRVRSLQREELLFLSRSGLPGDSDCLWKLFIILFLSSDVSLCLLICFS